MGLIGSTLKGADQVRADMGPGWEIGSSIESALPGEILDREPPLEAQTLQLIRI